MRPLTRRSLFAVVLALFLPPSAGAADLTPAQLDTLKTWLTANANGIQDEPAAALLNAAASPDWYVWRSNVTEDEFTQKGGVDVANSNAATVFNWTGTGYITRSQGERDAWARLFRNGAVNPSLPNVRQAFGDILSGGTAPAPANRNHLLVLSKRKATVGEKLYATGTGTFATPANMVVEGLITVTNVSEARNRP